MVIACLCGYTRLNAQAIVNEDPNEGLFKQNSTGYYKPMKYSSIRESDIMWRKRIWRTIDFRQKMNQVFYYPVESHHNWSNFIRIILDNWKEGNIVVYKFDTHKDELNDTYRYNEFMSERTRYEIDNETGDSIRDERGRPIPTTFNEQEVTRLNIMEDWYFDRQRSQMMVRILAIGPVIMHDGVPEQLFWVSYNEATRELFAKANFFNRDNPGMALNYDQVFMLRLFDSYIYKEENPYDRKIVEYAQGVEGMYESERIKQEIIDFEQNLWEY